MTVAVETREHAAPHLRDFAAQGAVYDGLMKSLREDTFVHAYLISGMRGVGKRSLARCIAQCLLCRGEKKCVPCGVCPSCVRIQDGTHPDVVTLRPEKSISVDTVREAVRLSGEHTYDGGRRVLIIEQAEKMTPAAQNSLLKTLEDPPADNVFLLLCEDTALLLPTIVSRCRVLHLHAWPEETVLRVLAQSGTPGEHRTEAARLSEGSLGAALALAGDADFWERRREVMEDFFALPSRASILPVSAKWKDRREYGDELLRDVEQMLRTLWFCHLGLLDEKSVSAYPEPWKHLAKGGGDDVFPHLMDAVFTARRRKASQATWQAVVEELLLHLTEEVQAW